MNPVKKELLWALLKVGLALGLVIGLCFALGYKWIGNTTEATWHLGAAILNLLVLMEVEARERHGKIRVTVTADKNCGQEVNPPTEKLSLPS